MGQEARLPYQPPAWLTPEQVANAVAVIGGSLILGAAMRETRLGLAIQLAIVVLVALWVAGTIHLVTRRGTSRSDAIMAMLFWLPISTAAAMMVVGAVFIALDSEPNGLIQVVPMGVGGYIGGLLLAPVSLPLAVVAASGRSRPNHEAPVHALMGGGLWVVGVAMLLLLAEASLAVLAPGALLFLVGAVWMSLRARFVRRVRAGRAPGFVIVESEGGAVDSGLMPYRPLRGVCIVDTLAAVGPDKVGVYRGVERPIPLCLVARRQTR